ncbi:MAG: translocation/assembly module TamB [Bacteroidales bacterium]|nr:translocation/assembly module TamB [Bacteroidales bacterium]
MRTLFKYIGRLFITLVALVLLLYLVIQLPAVQTWSANKIAAMLTKNTGADIKIKALNIKFFNRFYAEDVSVVMGDTLAVINQMEAKFSLKGLLSENLRLRSLKLNKGKIYIVNDTDSTTNLSRFLSIFKKEKKEESDTKFTLRRVEVTDFTLKYDNKFKERILINNLNTSISNFYFSKDSTSAVINSLSFNERCGLKLNSLTSDFKMTHNQIYLKGLAMEVDQSVINTDYLAFNYKDLSAFKTYADDVAMDIILKNTTLDLKTLGYIAPKFSKSDLKFKLNGVFEGPLRDLKAKYLTVVSQKGETSATIRNARFYGLPDVDNTNIYAEVERLSTTGKDLNDIIYGFTGKGVSVLENLPPLLTYEYSGIVRGKLNSLQTDGVLSSAEGAVNLIASLTPKASGKTPLLKGFIDAKDFNLAPFVQGVKLGRFTGRGNVEIIQDNGTVVNIDTLSIYKINFNGYNFTNLRAKGSLDPEKFEGKVICHDPALDLLVQGVISTSKVGDRTYNFYANIPYADLKALKLDNRDSISVISASISADLIQNRNNDIFGYVNIDDCIYTNSNGEFPIGNIDANSLYQNDKYVINFISDFAKGRYEGTTMIDGFIEQMKEQILSTHLGNLLSDRKESSPLQNYGENYSLTLQTLNMQGINQFICPGLYIQQGTSMRIRVSENDHYRIMLNSGRVALRENYLKNIRLNISDRDSLITASFFSKDISVAGFGVDSTRIMARGTDNNLGLSISFHNDTTGLNNTNLNTAVELLTDTVIVKINNSDITLKGVKWEINPSTITYTDSLIYIDNLKIFNGDQSLIAGGTLSKYRRDSLGIKMERFNIALLEQFLSNDFSLQGLLSGRAIFSLNPNSTNMMAGFRGDSMYVNNTPVGQAFISGKWSPENQRYDLLLQTKEKEQTMLNINGYYRPQDSFFDINSTLNDFSLSYFEKMLSSVISNTSGSINGKIHACGTPKELHIIGEDCRFNDFKFKINFLNVPYTLNGPFTINDNGITFKNNLITDNYGGKGVLSGGVNYKNLKDIKINTRVTLDNLNCLDTKEKDNEDFYGTAFTSGSVTIKGDTRKLNLNINATTRPKTFLHIPISGASKASRTNILVFRQPEKIVEIDPYDTLYFSAGKSVKEPMELDVALNLNCNNDADIWLEVDKSTGDIIKAKGSGRVGINVNPKKNKFKLSGNYQIDEGSYHFVLMGLTSRDFKVQSGSSISFNGDVPNTSLDITAIYRTKAAINRLISDSTFVSSRAVDATIHITGLLSNPEIKFGIDIPDLEPTTKVQVEAALNSEEKIQRQFAALLAFGSFVPEADSGISTNSNAIYANASGMLVGQLNNIFMQLGIPLDVGFNYQPGTKTFGDIFEVAISTQLFNNRVIINGSMGNNPYSFYTGNDVKGNIDVEVKMNRKGNLRMTFFSHASDFYSNDMDMSQRTGLGVAYQREFNSFRDIFRKKSAAQKEYERILRLKKKEERKERRKAKKQKKD